MHDQKMANYKRVFITGANGFIGKALAEKYRGLGAEIRGIDLVADAEAGIISGDLQQPEKWQDQLDGCDLILHLAALVSNTVSNDFAWRVNALGTSDLLSLGVVKGVKRFVHVSSVAAYGFDYPENVTEDYPLKPNGNPYVDSKIAAEHRVLACHASGAMDCTIIRPTDVYGPGSRPWVVIPLELIRAGQFLLPANGKSMFSPIYIDDLLDGIYLAAGRDEGRGQIFNIGGGIALTCEEFFANHNRWAGKTGPVKSVNTTLARLLATVAGGTARLFGKQSELGAGTVNMMARAHGYSIENARKLLGYEPRVDLQTGLQLTEKWLKDQGLI